MKINCSPYCRKTPIAETPKTQEVRHIKVKGHKMHESKRYIRHLQ